MSGWDAAAAGIDPGRVAELLVTLAEPGSGRRGSGYRVSASVVLTAAHVVRDAARVRGRFDADRPGEWLAEGSVAWSDPTVDVAVVAITPRPQDEGQVALVGFGRDLGSCRTVGPRRADHPQHHRPLRLAPGVPGGRSQLAGCFRRRWIR